MSGMRFLRMAALIALVAGCSRDEQAYRGPGLTVASIPTRDAVNAYRAALSGSFNVNDPSLWILVDSLRLPRTAGLEGGAPIAPELLSALRTAGVVKGVCTVPVQPTREPLRCSAERPGYAVRFSDLLQLGRDSMQVYMVVEQYATPSGPAAERLRFERAYHVSRRGTTWRATREARLPRP